MPDRLLITGGAGFIGSTLAEKFVQDGYAVRVLDDLSNSSISNIRGLFNHRNFKLVRGDIRDPDLVQRVSTGVDFILHLAAQIHVDRSIIEPRHTFEVNTLGTINVLEAAIQNDVKKVICASSSEVYGSAEYAPMNEQHPLNPCSPYAASKAAANRLCFSYFRTYGLNVVVVRPFNTFGPRQKSTGYGGAISIFIDRVMKDLPPIIYGDGKQTRDYSYVADTVRGFDLVLKSNDDLAGRAINFGTGKEVQIAELARLIIKLAGREGKLEPVHVAPRPGEVQRLCADISFARKQLGFSPQYDLERGLREFLDWHRKYKYEEWTKAG